MSESDDYVIDSIPTLSDIDFGDVTEINITPKELFHTPKQAMKSPRYENIETILSQIPPEHQLFEKSQRSPNAIPKPDQNRSYRDLELELSASKIKNRVLDKSLEETIHSVQDLATLEKLWTEYQQVITALKAKLKESTSSREKKLTEKIGQQALHMDKLNMELTKLRQQAKGSQTGENTAKGDQEMQDDDLSLIQENKRLCSKLNEFRSDYENKIDTNLKRQDALVIENNNFRKQIRKLQRKLIRQQNEKAQLQEDLDSVADIQSLKARIALLEEQNTRVTSENVELENKITGMNSELNSRQNISRDASKVHALHMDFQKVNERLRQQLEEERMVNHQLQAKYERKKTVSVDYEVFRTRIELIEDKFKELAGRSPQSRVHFAEQDELASLKRKLEGAHKRADSREYNRSVSREKNRSSPKETSVQSQNTSFTISVQNSPEGMHSRKEIAPHVVIKKLKNKSFDQGRRRRVKSSTAAYRQKKRRPSTKNL